jgi:hypothetical protein
MLESLLAELPPPLREPLAWPPEDLAPATRELVDGLLQADDPIVLALPTQTLVDVGHWFNSGQLWVGCTREALLLWALGKRPYRERILFSELRESLYNHVTGELMLAPGGVGSPEEARGLKGVQAGVKALARHLRLDPWDGMQILAQIYATEAEPHLVLT